MNLDHLTLTELNYLLEDIASQPSPDQSHLIRHVQNVIAEKYFLQSRPTPEQLLQDKVAKLSNKELSSYIDTFQECNLPVPRVLYEIQLERQQDEARLLLLKLLEDK